MKQLMLLYALIFLFAGAVISAQVPSPEPVVQAQPLSMPVAISQDGSWKWKSDFYRAVVIYNAENPVESDEGFNAIQAKAEEKIKSLNLSIRKVDVTNKANIDEKTAEALKLLENVKFPFTFIYLPENSDVENPLWSGNMSLEDADTVADSPARREIARRLLHGEAVVWLLIESGIEYKDYRILKLLTEEIKSIGIKTPDSDTPSSTGTEVGKRGNNLGKPVKMSIIRISRDEVAEKILLNILSGIEPEIMNVSNEPVLVPIHGRGRILNLISNDEISRENIRNMIGFFVGGSPEGDENVKPGTVLLLSVDWDEFAKGKLLVDEALPALREYSSNFNLDDVFPSEALPASDLKAKPIGAEKDKIVTVKPPFQMKVINIILISIIGTLILLFLAVVLRSKK